MNDRTCQKLKGRFIKKNDPHAKQIEINEFNLMEICESPVAYADNPKANIIYSRLHEESELTEAIRVPAEMDTVFEVNYRPVIKPLDFTEEWRRRRKQNSMRRTDDDEALDMEFRDLNREIETERRAKNEKKKNLKFQENIPDSIVNSDLAIEQKSDNSLEEELSTIKAQNKETEISENRPEEFSKRLEDPQSHFKLLDQDTNHEKSEYQFVPLAHEVLKTESDRPIAKKISEEEKQEIIEEAKAKGYEDGFRQGEEKANIEFREKFNQSLNHLENLFQDLEGLKKNILNNAQENFQILCQAMIENLLRKEFKANPESLKRVIERAIEEAVPDDKFKVYISNQSFDALKPFCSDQLLSKLKVSSDVKDYDFKIESSLTVVDGNISQIVSDLLEQADTTLYEQTEKAG